MNTISIYKKILVCFGIFLMLRHSSVRSEYIVSIATVKTRCLGMGGAFASVQDNLSALDFNPACLIINPAASGFEHTIFINALFPALLLKNLSSDVRLDYALGWLLRGTGFAVGRFQFGLLLGEQSLQGISEKGSTSLFRDSGYRYRRNIEAGANLILSPNVSMGMAGDFLIRGNEHQKDVAIGY